MGLWQELFHWRVLLRWDVFGYLFGLPLVIAGFFLAFDQYALANACFVIAALLFSAKVAQVAVIATDPWGHRLIFTFVLFGLTGIVIVETVRFVNKWAATKKRAAAAAGQVTETLADAAQDAKLCRDTETFIERLREFQYRTERDRIELQERHDRQSASVKTREEKISLNITQSAERLRLGENRSQDFQTRLQQDARDLHARWDARLALPELAADDMARIVMENGMLVGPHPISDLINHFQSVSKRVCD
jgi:signal transduction histidine kinase